MSPESESESENVGPCAEQVPAGTPHARTGSPYAGGSHWVCSRPAGHQGIHKACEGHHFNNEAHLWYEWLELFIIEEEFLP